MFLNCLFICCYSKSIFDYLLGTQKAQISWNDLLVYLPRYEMSL